MDLEAAAEGNVAALDGLVGDAGPDEIAAVRSPPPLKWMRFDGATMINSLTVCLRLRRQTTRSTSLQAMVLRAEIGPPPATTLPTVKTAGRVVRRLMQIRAAIKAGEKMIT